MQILNISVSNRPAKTETSKPYPVESVDKVYTVFGFDVIQLRPDPILVAVKLPVHDSITSDFQLQDIVLTEPPKINLDVNLGTVFGVDSIVLAELNTVKLPEMINADFGLNSIVSRPLIFTKIPESVDTGFNLDNIILEVI